MKISILNFLSNYHFFNCWYFYQLLWIFYQDLIFLWIIDILSTLWLKPQLVVPVNCSFTGKWYISVHCSGDDFVRIDLIRKIIANTMIKLIKFFAAEMIVVPIDEISSRRQISIDWLLPQIRFSFLSFYLLHFYISVFTLMFTFPLL